MHKQFLLLCAGSLLGQPLAAQYSGSLWPAPQSQHLLSVTGDAEVQVMPDRVVISVGVETRHVQLAAARAKSDSSVSSVLAAAVRNGVVAADVQTDFIEVTPVYRNTEDDAPVHYRVHKAMTVTLRDVRQFDALLTAVMEAGANQIYGVDFQTSELRKHRDKARELAMKAALEKAETLAAGAGLKVGKATAVTSYSAGSSSRYGRWRDPYRHDLRSQNVSLQQVAGDAGAAVGTFAPGRISVTASVSLSLPIQP